MACSQDLSRLFNSNHFFDEPPLQHGLIVVLPLTAVLFSVAFFNEEFHWRDRRSAEEGCQTDWFNGV
ncbi:hypothetical protein LZ31DRAFT_200730 [Colletotrichum somersetense]|nr:hypothetical protein LZ31DRAFT_200730 [Colletotrichum somersetense]